MVLNYIEHLKKLFSEYDGPAEIDIAEWQKGGRWKDNPVRISKLFESIRKTYKPRAKKNNTMLSVSTALFTRGKDNTFHASQANATHIYEILFDIDNDEFKSKKDELTEVWDIQDLLAKTQSELWERTRETLEISGLLPYATVIASGAGIHVHFFLSEIVALDETYHDIPFTDIRNAIVNELLPILGADPIPSQIQAKGKWIIGTPYTKLPFAVETKIINDARDFLSLPGFYNKIWEIKNKKTNQSSHYVGLLGEYLGPEEFINGDGSIITINKDFRMWLKEETGQTDSNENMIYKFKPIHSGMAILPKYVVVNANTNDDEEDDSDVLYIVNALNAKEERLVNLPLSAFEASDKLQKHFVKHNIDFAVERNRRQLFSYVRTHSQKVLAVEIGRQKDMLVHYNFIYKYGKIWPAHKRIVKITHNEKEEIFYIKGADVKKENEKDPQYASEHPVPQGSVDKMLAHMNQILKNQYKNKLFLAWMATSLVRDKILASYKEMPNLNLYGEAGTGKTTLLDAAARIFNIREQTAHPTMHNLYRKQKDMKNMIIALDDFSDMDYYRDFLKDSVRSSIRPRRTEDGGIAFPEIRNSLMLTTNYAITDDTVTNRMIKLFFNKNEIIENRKAYSEFDNFIDNNQLSIMLDLYNKVQSINWKEFKEIVDGLIEFGITKIQDVRIVKMYAIVCAIASVTGIHLDSVELFYNVIEEEKHTATDKRQLLDVIVDYAINEEEKELGYVPNRINRRFIFSHQKFTKYLDIIKYDRNVTQKTVTKEMAPYRNFIKSKRTTVKDVGHGVMYFVDFGNNAFSDYFEEIKETYVVLRKEDARSA